MRITNGPQDGFTLVELLVVVVIIGILAAIAIPRYLEQREEAFNAAAISDLRNLVAIETSLEATTGLTTDRTILYDEGWAGSSDRIVVCGLLEASPVDLTLVAWHQEGNIEYTYKRSSAIIETSDNTSPTDSCGAQGYAGYTLLWPEP